MSLIVEEEFLPRFDGDVFRLPIRVYNQDIDAGRVVYAGNFIRFMERCRAEWLRHIGIEQRYMERELRAGFVIHELHARYLKPAFLDELLVATAELVELGRSVAVMRQTVERCGTVLCTGDLTFACVRFPNGRPCAIPPQVRVILQARLSSRTAEPTPDHGLIRAAVLSGG